MVSWLSSTFLLVLNNIPLSGQDSLRGTLPGPKSGLLSNTFVQVDRHADKASDFIGKRGTQVESKRTQENCSATWLPVLGYMVMKLVSQLSLTNCSGSKSFLVTQPRWIPARRILGGWQDV